LIWNCGGPNIIFQEEREKDKNKKKDVNDSLEVWQAPLLHREEEEAQMNQVMR
jgi:hypothetical protein